MLFLNRPVPYCLLIFFLLATGCKQEKSIVILHDNDVHCSIDGYMPIAGYRNAIVDADTSYVAVVSSGDYLQGGSIGSISKGGYIVDLMNAVGYDVVTLGNHEFDFGIEHLMQLTDSLHAQVVSANFTLPGSTETVFPAYTIRSYGNKKVAFVGATTPGTIISEAYSFYDEDGFLLYDLHEADIVEMIQCSVDSARAEGADYVILLSHLGEVPVLSQICSTDIIPQLHGINAVLEAHTHNLIPEQWLTDAEGKQVLLTQTGTRYSHIGQLTISSDGTFHSSCTPLEEFAQYSDSATQAVVEHINTDIFGLMEQNLISADFKLYSYDSHGNRIIRYQETNLGDLIADALRMVGGTQIALMNGGGVRTDLEKGSLQYKHVLDVLPFGNEIVVLELSGQEIIDLLEWTSQKLPLASGSFLQPSGLRYTVDTRIKNELSVDDQYVLQVNGQRRVAKVEVLDGKQYVPINPTVRYTLTTISFISETTHAFPVLKNAYHLQDEFMGDVECLIQYISQMNGTIPEEYRNPQGRINIIQ